ncbi:aldehyde dehydrogenase family protein [Streptomyces sp. NPDC051907]|uniref:aldehyde dehydrogenase family protein n=1 Tax=Streptomyces sp. NPDC051907 TaxID=3155284 RepID=UPI003413F679
MGLVGGAHRHQRLQLTSRSRQFNRIDAGMVWINDFYVIDARYPFGGMKQSGLGRELGHNALDEYTEVKHVAYATSRRNDPHPYAVLFGNR